MLFSFESSVTFNGGDEKAYMLFLSMNVSLTLVDSCDSQYHSIKKQYVQTL